MHLEYIGLRVLLSLFATFRPARTERQGGANSRNPPGTANMTNIITALIVDNDKEMRHFANEVLTKLGAGVLVACDSREARKLESCHAFDCIASPVP